MSTRPNILFLMADQHSVRSMGDHPDTPVETPNLMQLAAEGVRFDAAYCQNPLCVPSRSILLASSGTAPIRRHVSCRALSRSRKLMTFIFHSSFPGLTLDPER